jgi:hypothetical protein
MALLRVYLVPEPGKKEYLPEAIALLNSHLADLDVAKVGPNMHMAHGSHAKVLALVPNKWSVGLISKFLKRSIRTSMHSSRTAQIEESLARFDDGVSCQPVDHCRQDHLQVAQEYFALSSKCFTITEQTRCRVCEAPIGDDGVARYVALPFAIGINACMQISQRHHLPHQVHSRPEPLSSHRNIVFLRSL